MKRPEAPDEMAAHEDWSKQQADTVTIKVSDMVAGLKAAHLATETEKLMAMQDAISLGVGWLRVNPDGSSERVDPSTITHQEPNQ